MATIMKVKDDENLAERLNDTLLQVRKPLITGLVVLLVAILGLVAVVLVNDSAKKKGLAQLDEIYFTLTKDVSEVSDEELAAREAAALTALESFASKNGAIASRANLLIAEIQFQKQDYAAARDAWLRAAQTKQNAYTAPLAYFNAGVCSEKLSDLASAIDYYAKAADTKDFLLSEHALFSLGRVNETKGDFAAAQAAYERLTAAASGSNWTNLAKTRLLALQSAGSIE